MFYAHGISLALAVIGLVFFYLSYTTGYINIVFGEKNSLLIQALMIASIAILIGTIVLHAINKRGFRIVLNISTVILSVLLTLAILYLLADRVDAIGNCIVAPWDAGHGGEDSCYLSFVSMGGWLIAVVLLLIASFKGSGLKE